MLLPDYKLISTPKRYRNGHGRTAKYFSQKYRLLAEPTTRVRSVSLQTGDLTIARRRAVRYVEDAIRKIVLAADPEARTASKGIVACVKEYTDHLTAIGNGEKGIEMTNFRLNRIIKTAHLKEYAQLDAVVVTKAIAKLMKKYEFGVNTANHYRATARAWSHWMALNGRWPTDVLHSMGKIKGDTSPRRKRAILTDAEFEKLLRITKDGPDRRNLSGEMRFWLYLIASQTGIRAHELSSLKVESFHLDADPPYVEVHCTVSKRRLTDIILLRRDFAELLRPWLAEQDPFYHLWSCSASWYYNAAPLVRFDLEAAGIDHMRPDGSVIDFHSFRALRVTKCILSGASSRVVMSTVRLSSESLLARYTKISQEDIAACVDAVLMPKLT